MVPVCNTFSAPIESGAAQRYWFAMDGGYYFLNDGVTLQNIPRITNCAELDRAVQEAEESARQRILASGDYPGLAGLLAIHKDTYKDLFRWAGKYRTADIPGERPHYDPAAFVQPNLEYIFARYDKAKATGSLDRGLMGELLFFLAAAHPFWQGSRFAENLWLEVNHPNVLERPRALEGAREKALLAGKSDPLSEYLTKTTL
jgi:fido (protein-threonine AMPylation protein)